ncbi:MULTISPECIES: sulfite exporter TauE/SafE family protein [unclassified Picosynechococcus]|uniref:sulfite exporter TauE/SafE family protein n=1 Tax=unclassified Picosynechococcus TaxID=3079910 RepID=UPI0004AA4246|nr:MULTISPECIES: sulfite exporter TauE/SafE family protein [unclassified Picosynechococcus]
MMQLLGYFLAACIGISLGLMGGGGSVLAVPILVYVMGVDPKSAIAMTLFIVGIVSAVGLVPHWRQGNINLKKAGIFGSATMVGAFLGAQLTRLPFITGTVQLLLFAVMMLIAAIFMIRKSGKAIAHQANEPHLEDYPAPVCRYCWLWLLTEGLGIGILTGLVGVGGGFAIVPALVLLGKTEMKEAVGTSLVIIVMNAIAGFLGYFGQADVVFDWHLMVNFTFVASLGILLGGYSGRYFNAKQLQKGFGYFLLAVAAFILFQQRDRLPRLTTLPETTVAIAQQK